MEQTIKGLFVAAWNDCRNPELDGTNPHFRNQYATLRSTLAAVREACAKHGIAYVQRFEEADENRGVLRSLVIAPTGEEMPLSEFPVECPPNPQSFGSALTYAKRQQAQADWGITGEEDDDAEAAVAPGNPTGHPLGNTVGKRPAAPKPDRRGKMLARCAELSAKCIENGMNAGATENYMRARFKVEGMGELTDEQLVEFGTYLAEMEAQSRGRGDGGDADLDAAVMESRHGDFGDRE